jgi:hypothetical protein
VIVRGNHVRDAYNAIRMVVRNPDICDACNWNVEICDNRFERIRDNPIEPEGHALNWFVHDNQFVNCHAWFSLDGVRGGYFYPNLGFPPGLKMGNGSLQRAFRAGSDDEGRFPRLQSLGEDRPWTATCVWSGCTA